jgi:hypothetical protein
MSTPASTDIYVDPSTFKVVPHADVKEGTHVQVNTALIADLLRFGLFYDNKDVIVQAACATDRQTRASVVVDKEATETSKAETHRELSITTTFSIVPQSVVEYYFNHLGGADIIAFSKSFMKAKNPTYKLNDEGKPTKELDVEAMYQHAGEFLAAMVKMDKFTAIIPALLQQGTTRAISLDANSMREDDKGNFSSVTTLPDLTGEFVTAVLSNNVVDAIAAVVRLNMRFHRSLKETPYSLKANNEKLKDIMTCWLKGAATTKAPKHNKSFITSALNLMGPLKGNWMLSIVAACRYLCQPRKSIESYPSPSDHLPFDAAVASRIALAIKTNNTRDSTVGNHGLDDAALPEKAFGSRCELGAIHLSRTAEYDIDTFYASRLPEDADDKAAVQQFCKDLVANGTPSDLIRAHLATHKLIKGVKSTSGRRKRKPVETTSLDDIDLDMFKTENLEVQAGYYLHPPDRRFARYVVQLKAGDVTQFFVATVGQTEASNKGMANVAVKLDTCREAWGLVRNNLLFDTDSEVMYQMLSTVEDSSAPPALTSNPKFTINGDVADFVDASKWCSTELTPISASDAPTWSDDVKLDILKCLAFRALHLVTVRHLGELFYVKPTAEDEEPYVVMAPEFNRGSKVAINTTDPWEKVLFGSSKAPTPEVFQTLYTQIPQLLEVVQGWKESVVEETAESEGDGKKKGKKSSDDDDDDSSSSDDDDEKLVCGLVSPTDLISRLDLLILCLQSNVKSWTVPVKEKKKPAAKKKTTTTAAPAKSKARNDEEKKEKKKTTTKEKGSKKRKAEEEEEEEDSDADMDEDADSSDVPSSSSEDDDSDSEEEEEEEKKTKTKKRRKETKTKTSPPPSAMKGKGKGKKKSKKKDKGARFTDAVTEEVLA